MTHAELDLLALAGAVPAGEHATWRALLASDLDKTPGKAPKREVENV